MNLIIFPRFNMYFVHTMHLLCIHLIMIYNNKILFHKKELLKYAYIS